MKTKKEINYKVKALKNMLQSIMTEVEVISNRHEENAKNIAKLTGFGCLKFNEYWKDGKYLYLRYQKDGKKVKRYIGNDPALVSRYRWKKENYDKREWLIMENEQLEERLDAIRDAVEYLSIQSGKNVKTLFTMEV